MKFFSTESGLYKFMTGLTNVLKINILWLLCSLPIITVGAATIAAFDVTLKMVDDEEGYVGRQFIKAFKTNLKRGIPMGLLAIFCVYVVWLDFSLFFQIPDASIVLPIFGIVAAFVFTFSFLYAFALQARYENTILCTLENSIRISFKYFVRSLFLVILLIVEFVIIFWNMTTMFIGLLIGPVCIIFTISGFAKYIFRQLEKEPGAVSNPEDLEDNR